MLRLWRPMAGWTLLVWGAVTALLAPLTSALLGRYLLRGERSVVGNEELLAWLLTPRGFLYLLLAGAVAVTAGVVRYAGYFRIVTDDLNGRRALVRRTALALAPQLPRLYRLCLAAVAGALLLALPLLLGLLLIHTAFLRAHDINFYLAARPPEWRWALGAAAAWSLLWAGGALYVVGRSLLALPAYLDGRRRVRDALRSSWSRSEGGPIRLVRVLVACLAGWLLLRMAVNATWLAAAGLAVEWADRFSAALWPITLATGLYLAGSLALDVVVAFLGFALVTTVVTKFYYEDTPLHAEAPPPPGLGDLTRKARTAARSWARPRRVVAAGLVLYATGLAGSRLLLADAPPPRPVTITAHRGGPPPAPENTLAALDRTIAAGADVAEIDVQLTADGVVVLLHDADLMRMAGDPRRISRVTWAEVASLVQLPDDGSPPDDRRLLTLGEALDHARRHALGLNVELKYYGWDPDLAPAVVREVRSRGMEPDVVLMSLSLDGVRQLRELAPDLTVGFVSTLAVGDVSRLPVHFVAVPSQAATPRFIRAAHGRGLEVHVWTVNRAGTMAELILRGVDGIITDDPALAVRVRDEMAALSAPGRLLLRVRGFVVDDDAGGPG
jgi:glycerophosphoryl diester phosphodiesterase